MTQIDLTAARIGDQYLTRNGRRVILSTITDVEPAYPYRFRYHPADGHSFTTTVRGTFYTTESAYHPCDIVSKLTVEMQRDLDRKPAAEVQRDLDRKPAVYIDADTALKRLEHWIDRAVRAEAELVRLKDTPESKVKLHYREPRVLAIDDIGCVHSSKDVLDRLQARLERALELEKRAKYVEQLRQSMKGSYGKIGDPNVQWLKARTSVLQARLDRMRAAGEGDFLAAPPGWYLSQLRHNHHRPAHHKTKVPSADSDGPWIAAFRSLVGIKRVSARGRTASEALARARAKTLVTRIDPYQECDGCGDFFD